MTDADLWLEWRFPGTAEWLREVIPELGHRHGFDVGERRSLASRPDWATFEIRPRGGALAVGLARAQDFPDGQVQLLIAPAPGQSDPAAIAQVNDFAVLLWTELVRLGRIDPPKPLRAVSRPLGV